MPQQTSTLAAKATNGLAVDLQRKLATDNENLCVSPYSIENALAMTFAGADGDTRAEMARVLHFASDSSDVARLVRFAPAFAGRNEREDCRTRKKIEGIRWPDRTDHIKHRQLPLCSKRLRFSSGFFVAGKTKLSAPHSSRSISSQIPRQLHSTSTNGWQTRRATRFAISYLRMH